MIFNTVGNKSNPTILFFHAMGVTGDSSIPVADFLKEQYYCIMPTSTVYCAGQKYIGKTDEIRQISRPHPPETLSWISWLYEAGS